MEAISRPPQFGLLWAVALLVGCCPFSKERSEAYARVSSDQPLDLGQTDGASANGEAPVLRVTVFAPGVQGSAAQTSLAYQDAVGFVLVEPLEARMDCADWSECAIENISVEFDLIWNDGVDSGSWSYQTIHVNCVDAFEAEVELWGEWKVDLHCGGRSYPQYCP